MLNAHCHFYVPEHGCSIEGSVRNFSARVGRNACSLSFLHRQPGTARWSVHPPCRDALRFVVSAVAEAPCGMLWQGPLRVKVELQLTSISETVGRKQKCHLPAVPRPHTERDLQAYSVPAIVTKSMLTLDPSLGQAFSFPSLLQLRLRILVESWRLPDPRCRLSCRRRLCL